MYVFKGQWKYGILGASWSQPFPGAFWFKPHPITFSISALKRSAWDDTPTRIFNDHWLSMRFPKTRLWLLDLCDCRCRCCHLKLTSPSLPLRWELPRPTPQLPVGWTSPVPNTDSSLLDLCHCRSRHLKLTSPSLPLRWEWPRPIPQTARGMHVSS